MTTPSAEDLATTSRLIEVGKILGISVLDHIIVGDGEFCSLRETTTIFK
jgi:DNA repair protein RadC